VKAEYFKGALLSTLLIVSILAPAISVISLLSVGHVSATPDDNIVRGKVSAYAQNNDANPPWVEYGTGSLPPIIASKTVGAGKVVIAGISSSCRDGRWNSTYMNENYRKLHILLDKAFQWMKPGASKVLWFGGDGSGGTENEYYVYNNPTRCGQLIENLKLRGYTVENTIGGGVDTIAGALASKNPDILVIPQMELGTSGTGGDPSQLPDWEVENIYDFVANKGRGLLILEGNDTDGYNYNKVQNKILKRLDTGIYFQSDVVRDDENCWPTPAYPWQIYADVADIDFGAAYRSETGLEAIGLYNVCSLAPKTDYEIAIAISPTYREGFPGGKLTYTANIANAGWNPDNYTLSILDNIWPVTLSETTLSNVENDTSRTVTITVHISSDASIGDNNEIRLRVHSQGGNKDVDKKFLAMAGNRIRPAWEDTGVQENEPTRPFGTEIWAQVASRENADMNWKDMRIWIKFDLRAIPDPVSIKPGNWSADNLKARLFVYCDYISGTPGENVRCYMVDNDAWTETGMNWNNQPSLPPENYDTTKVTREDYWYSWDVTQLIREKLKRTPRENFASFCLRAETEGAAYPDNFYYSFDMMNLPDTRYHAYIVIGYDVDVWISQRREWGMPKGTLKYRVNVWNRGSFADNYSLSVVENQWQATLDITTMLNVQPTEIRTATLSVKVPDAAVPDVDNDNIRVRATSLNYTAEKDNDNCTAHASMRITPVEDTSTRGRVHLENAIYGSAYSIYIGRYLDGPQRGWLKFDLNAIGVSIAKAYLKLYCYDNSRMGATMRVYGVGDSWNQDNLNWFNQYTELGSPLDKVAFIENRRWYSFDVTSFVSSEYAGDKVASFCVVDLGENVSPDHAALMDSKEYGLDNFDNKWPYLEILSEAPENEVRVYVNPTFQGDRAGRVDNYVITIKNKGTSGKTYNLTIENTENWTWNLDSSSLWVSAGGENSTTLHVTIPSTAAVGTVNRITITAKSALNPSENDVTRCYAERGEVYFGLDNKPIGPIVLGALYVLRADFKLYVGDSSGGLRMYFYTYDNVLEGTPVTVWDNTPWNLDSDVMGPIYIPHSGGKVVVKKAKLFWMDNTGPKLKGWVTIRSDLWDRIGKIRMTWPYATPGQRSALWTELGDIRSTWPYAPTARDPVWIED
jgi:hypothetical protein